MNIFSLQKYLITIKVNASSPHFTVVFVIRFDYALVFFLY